MRSGGGMGAVIARPTPAHRLNRHGHEPTAVEHPGHEPRQGPKRHDGDSADRTARA
jgi:hypothetical protein